MLKLARVDTFAIDGAEARRVWVESDIRHGLPAFSVVGLADKAVPPVVATEGEIKLAVDTEWWKFDKDRSGGLDRAEFNQMLYKFQKVAMTGPRTTEEAGRAAAAAFARADTNKDGKTDAWIFDDDRDGKWDVSYWDTDFDGKPDLVGHHPDGELKPTRMEKYQPKS